MNLNNSTFIEKSHVSHPNLRLFEPKIIVTALLIATVAGLVIATLSVMHLFGPIGSIGHIVGIITGGSFSVVCGSIFVWKLINLCKSKNEQKNLVDLDKGKSPSLNKEDLASFLATTIKSGETISSGLEKIPNEFFAEKSQERAKSVFSSMLSSLLGESVSFPVAGIIHNLESLNGQLHQEVFQISTTHGVQFDIPRSSKDKGHIHVYQVASQYNASEAPNPFTPAIGRAMEISNHDHTQGPLSQRTNPNAFELVTAFLTHLGFNMLNEVLPSAGHTFLSGSAIEYGYLRPDDSNIDILTAEFQSNFSKAEYVAYTSCPKSWGKNSQPVHILLQAAPAIGYAHLNSSSHELERYAALANYLALFRYGIQFAQDTGLSIVLHAGAIGGGVFGNKTENLLWGFEKAALACQSEMLKAKVKVQLESYKGSGPMSEIASQLNIADAKRIGDSE